MYFMCVDGRHYCESVLTKKFWCLPTSARCDEHRQWRANSLGGGNGGMLSQSVAARLCREGNKEESHKRDETVTFCVILRDV